MKLKLHSRKDIIKLSMFLKVFSDPTRLRVIDLLREREMYVGDIAETLEMSQSSISHQLSILRNMHLVSTVKQGKTVLYRLSDHHILDIFDKGMEHVKEGEEE